MAQHGRQARDGNQTPRIVVLDNRDSFTFNLVHALLAAGAEAPVLRSDRTSVAELRALQPNGLLIGPGPGPPQRAGCSLEVLRAFAGTLPILGVCLGHQAIAVHLGGSLRRARTLLHGRTSEIRHDGRGVFADLPTLFRATRYHSLAIDEDTWPAALQVTARAEDGEVMGLRQEEQLLEGVQFHPEAVRSEAGAALFRNFVEAVRRAASSAATAPSSAGVPPTAADAARAASRTRRQV